MRVLSCLVALKNKHFLLFFNFLKKISSFFRRDFKIVYNLRSYHPFYLERPDDVAFNAIAAVWPL